MLSALAGVVEAASGQISVAVAATGGSTAGFVVDWEKKGPRLLFGGERRRRFLPCSFDI
jgi:hypothetical protein